MSRTILVVAGEASGDALGAGVISAARRHDPSIRFVGIGGEAMARAGAELLVGAETIAVVGVVEVLSRLRSLLAARRLLRRALEDERPFRVLLIDFPDFNLAFARDARRRGASVHYFVSPQVWAWRSGRVRTIARLVDRMIVIFPFEESIYREAGVPVSYVGHPLLDLEPPPIGRDEARARLALPPGRRMLALLPGSRSGEVRALLPVLLGAAGRLRRTRVDLDVVIPVASTLDAAEVDRIVARDGASWARPVRERFYECLDGADAAVVASGTATLQAAMRRTPMVVVYRMNPLTALLARRLLRVRDIALANLVAGARIVPELVQDECTPARIESAVAPLLDDRNASEAQRAALGLVRERLGPPGAFDRAARIVIERDPGSPCV